MDLRIASQASTLCPGKACTLCTEATGIARTLVSRPCSLVANTADLQGNTTRSPYQDQMAHPTTTLVILRHCRALAGRDAPCPVSRIWSCKYPSRRSAAFLPGLDCRNCWVWAQCRRPMRICPHDSEQLSNQCRSCAKWRHVETCVRTRNRPSSVCPRRQRRLHNSSMTFGRWIRWPEEHPVALPLQLLHDKQTNCAR